MPSSRIICRMHLGTASIFLGLVTLWLKEFTGRFVVTKWFIPSLKRRLIFGSSDAIFKILISNDAENDPSRGTILEIFYFICNVTGM